MKPSLEREKIIGCPHQTCALSGRCLQLQVLYQRAKIAGTVIPEECPEDIDYDGERGEYFTVDDWKALCQIVTERATEVGCPNANLIKHEITRISGEKITNGTIYQFNC